MIELYSQGVGRR